MGRSPRCVIEGLQKGAWTAMEDKKLIEYVEAHGEGKWPRVAKLSGLKRCGKSCRFRWMNYIKPGIKRGNITPDEEDLIIRLHKLLGNRWSLIAGRLPDRTDNEIKNYWNTTLSKKLVSSNITVTLPCQPFEARVTQKSPTKTNITNHRTTLSKTLGSSNKTDIKNHLHHHDQPSHVATESFKLQQTPSVKTTANNRTSNQEGLLQTFDDDGDLENYFNILDLLNFSEFDNVDDGTTAAGCVETYQNSNIVVVAKANNISYEQHDKNSSLLPEFNVVLPNENQDPNYQSTDFLNFPWLFDSTAVADEDYWLHGDHEFTFDPAA